MRDIAVEGCWVHKGSNIAWYSQLQPRTACVLSA